MSDFYETTFLLRVFLTWESVPLPDTGLPRVQFMNEWELGRWLMAALSKCLTDWDCSGTNSPSLTTSFGGSQKLNRSLKQNGTFFSFSFGFIRLLTRSDDLWPDPFVELVDVLATETMSSSKMEPACVLFVSMLEIAGKIWESEAPTGGTGTAGFKSPSSGGVGDRLKPRFFVAKELRAVCLIFCLLIGGRPRFRLTGTTGLLAATTGGVFGIVGGALSVTVVGGVGGVWRGVSCEGVGSWALVRGEVVCAKWRSLVATRRRQGALSTAAWTGEWQQHHNTSLWFEVFQCYDYDSKVSLGQFSYNNELSYRIVKLCCKAGTLYKHLFTIIKNN